MVIEAMELDRPLVFRNLAQGKTDRHRSMTEASSENKGLLSLNRCFGV